MVAGADIDARSYLLPDSITFGATALGIIFAFVLAPAEPWPAVGFAVSRAAGLAIVFAAVRHVYKQLRGAEGLGLGDVKLAAVGGAWLSMTAIPTWLCLASTAGLVAVLMARLRGRPVNSATRVPFGAFLCPALWLVFYLTALLDKYVSI